MISVKSKIEQGCYMEGEKAHKTRKKSKKVNK